MSPPTVNQAYQYCRQLARQHYENFPVASHLLPKQMRNPVSAIYAFARTADDFADENDRTAQQRLALLEDYSDKLVMITSGLPVDDPVFVALSDVIKHYALPLPLFADLLSAFEQDVTKTRYKSFEEVADYCQRSANPVGRLLLMLYGETIPEYFQLSDNICTSLQLINFLQDLAHDFDMHNRIYLPQNEMTQFGVTESHFRDRINDARIQALVNIQINRAQSLLIAGAPLGQNLTGRIGLELRLIIQGADRMLNKLRYNSNDVFQTPRLNKFDHMRMLWTALFLNKFF